MNIGQVASETGISAKMIRYYETVGLLNTVQRTEAGYRIYTENEVQTLYFIRSARDLGFSVSEIQELLALWRDKNRASEDVKRLTQQHINDLEKKAKSLQEMANTLRHLVCHCQGDDRPDCPIIQKLASK
ncbi:Cu(I)-responsive transcriptional regulator [Entomomonas asaccharolytica]|uniref:Cu(I)-responsive transcriptional regulator n=1 Tax=Entomomonas asaccharolytica TaxID=2785331 RepID=A0A974NG19_9GAMM|nr:Cu(I)-responsive transcriptional regulator [Entomomonas asaccharolytica]QQP86115.1 Cu(I)-responsive transcriptional regulator [Entomomonas asaccharolytica]